MEHSPRFLALCEQVRAQVREMTTTELRQQMGPTQEFVLIDTREESEWAAGHIPGAIHLSKGVIERDIENKVPDLDTPIVAYCGGGFRSALVCENLQRMGYRNLWSVAGGFRSWKDEGGKIDN
jgi:rhodanese-related sulfurtransferase